MTRLAKKSPRKPKASVPSGPALAAISSHMADTGDDVGAPAGPLFNWLQTRAAGVLFHPTSLPSAQGCGVFDANLLPFLDFLQAGGFRYWQLCPLGPTGYGDSPYQCFSSFAGNPYLIDLGALVRSGLLTAAEIAPLAKLDHTQTDYGDLHRLKWPLLYTAHERFARQPENTLPYGDFAVFRQKHAAWLEPYAYFRALKDHLGGGAWFQWPAKLRSFAAAQSSPLRAKLAPAIAAHEFTQYLFFGQWAQVRAAARERDIEIIGDLPIFVAADSADAWAHPELFELDPKSLRPVAVAGVPPDYFSKDGQLWGNPLYHWETHAADGYAWWLRRIAAAFSLYDVVRIDHFRGLDAYWRVPARAKTAKRGAWVPGPGLSFFRAMHHAFPAARLIAEDLGVQTDSMRELLAASGLPGMSVLQFAFGNDATNAYLPHLQMTNAVVYTGTHDNDTSLGWYRTAPEKTRDHVRRYLRVTGAEMPWDFIRAAYESPARLAVIPLTDLLSLDSAARFNTPSKARGNWQWRVSTAQLAALRGGTEKYLRSLADLYGR